MAKKYILIGAIPTNDPKSYGGTTVLMKQMLDYYEDTDIDYIYIKTNKFEHSFSFLKNYFYVIFHLLKELQNVDVVMVNVARNGAFFLSPIVFFFTKLFGKKFVFRMFGGNFVSLYKRNLIRSIIANLTFLRSDAIFVETKEILTFLKNKNNNTYWFPNIRKQMFAKKSGVEFSKRFVFISSVKQTKGIDEIVEAIAGLDKSFNIDIYGPIQDSKYSLNYFKDKNVCYKGSLSPENVLETLANYDVILLPTYHAGEGYPGILIEGYSMGIPCITTKWQAIPEIVDHNKTGLLIGPKKSKELISAMQVFNKENYATFSENALKKFEEFRCENVYKKITNICEGL